MLRSCPIIAETPPDASYFFGFHDISPWSFDGRFVLLHRFETLLSRLPSGREIAQIVIWDQHSNRFETIGETTTWNLQQGARAAWVPGYERAVAFNRLVDGVPGCQIVDLAGGTRRDYAYTIGAISPDGRYSLSPNFGRLARYWKAYGYQGVPPSPDIGDPAPARDGIWRLDFHTGDIELMVPIAALSGYGKPLASTAYRFVTHISFNPSGTLIAFYDRYITNDGALFSRLCTSRPDGTDIVVLAEEKVSHFVWLNDELLLVWMRNSVLPIASIRRAGLLASPWLRPLVRAARLARGRMKSALLQEAFYEVDARKRRPPKPFATALLTEDGHPMLSPDGHWIVVDSYPDKAGRIPLMLVDRKAKGRIDIGQFHHGATTTDGDLKCDFHPRWNRDGTRISGDLCTDGRRSMVIVDATPAMVP